MFLYFQLFFYVLHRYIISYISLQVPESPNFKVRFTLNVIKGGGLSSQFYLMDMGGCWKNNGQPCDGDVTSDVTRYSEMILNPNTTAWCRPDNLNSCPPYHTFPNGTRVHRNDTSRYPYRAYHMYCSPGNGEHLEKPNNLCDPFSNPQAQEILQILPHPVWGDYGYPTKQGEGWIGNPRTWELDVGRLSHSLYFYQVCHLLEIGSMFTLQSRQQKLVIQFLYKKRIKLLITSQSSLVAKI